MPEQAHERARPNSSRSGSDVRIHIEKAYGLLEEANRRSIQVPAGIIVALTEAREAWFSDHTLRDYAQEAKFWNAYGLLSSIEPTERARRNYMAVFVVSFSVLLGCQLYYVCGTLVAQQLAQLDAEYRAEIMRAGAPQTAATGRDRSGLNVTSRAADRDADDPDLNRESAPTPVSQQIGRIKTDRLNRAQAYYHIERRLMGHFGPDPRTPPPGPESEQATRQYWTDFQVCLDLLNLYLLFMAQYILPVLYGLLGACAFVLRRLSDPIGELAYAHRLRVRYTLRLFIGPLAGVASGLLVNSTTSGTATLAGLTPLAIAFCAGYSSHILFFMLDKIVSPFLGPVGSDSSSRTETTVSGLTMTTAVQHETHVEGPPISPAGSRARADAVHPSGPAEQTVQDHGKDSHQIFTHIGRSA